MSKSVTAIRHPEYIKLSALWKKYRYTYESGDDFINEYLEYFSTRETTADYNARRKMTYCPSYAKAEVTKVKNSIYEKMIDVTRISNLASYDNAIKGMNGGVDRQNSSMTGYIGNEILPELLFMGRVGVYVDRAVMPPNPSLVETNSNAPYLYTYKAEAILSWTYDEDNELSAILLYDRQPDVDETTGLTYKYQDGYRYLHKIESGVEVIFYDQKGTEIGREILNLDTIPFVLFELSESLLVDVANYQIAHLNISSSDVSYTLKANYPFYTEQFDPRAMNAQRLSGAAYDDDGNALEPGSSAEANAAKDNVIRTGIQQGRKYPKGLERPQYIHPSSEPLKASMEKQENIKQEIRDLVHLTLGNITGQGSDKTGTIQSGMANISVVLENGERQIAKIWSEYEGVASDIVIKYPKTYTLKTDAERREEAKQLEEHIAKTPSTTLKKALAKKIADILVSTDISPEEMQTIYDEIDAAEVIVLDPEVIKADHEAGFVSTKLASTLRGYPEGEVEQAKLDHAERIKRIALAQSSASEANLNRARGVDDMDDGTNTSGRNEKALSRETDTDSIATDKTRGESDA